MDFVSAIFSFLTGGIGGAVIRLAPEVLKLFQSKGDRDHEFRMRELDWKVAKEQGEQKIRELDMSLSAQQIVKDMDAIIEATKVQGQLTGNKFVDGLNAIIRPVLTLWWMVLLTVHKICMIIYWREVSEDGKEFATRIWTPEDSAILGSIIGFWFVDRSLRHARRGT